MWAQKSIVETNCNFVYNHIIIFHIQVIYLPETIFWISSSSSSKCVKSVSMISSWWVFQWFSLNSGGGLSNNNETFSKAQYLTFSIGSSNLFKISITRIIYNSIYTIHISTFTDQVCKLLTSKNNWNKFGFVNDVKILFELSFISKTW